MKCTLLIQVLLTISQGTHHPYSDSDRQRRSFRVYSVVRTTVSCVQVPILFMSVSTNADVMQCSCIMSRRQFVFPGKVATAIMLLVGQQPNEYELSLGTGHKRKSSSKYLSRFLSKFKGLRSTRVFRVQ
jgi:hypothetical protein